ncbi:YodC family protein [Pseudomonas sp. NMI760_13]|uniref:YodC family protein n=1 Tax=Pseudomonas sp. NMI760_13 TaxID=2903147 RepID=UPI001E3D58BB|nr:DUF2158 domain-containing protein [Pseudomonas sp. NMI760_13]MCE0917975.1 DUF2158 domain-containing protein [Pseudomonas sp. NMI760_13]
MAKANGFKDGQIVKLKSGGPDMTVKAWSSLQEAYECQWFAGKKLERGFFTGESLEISKPEKN